jgi:hypothetical protein
MMQTLSNVALNFNLRHYTVPDERAADAAYYQQAYQNTG